MHRKDPRACRTSLALGIRSPRPFGFYRELARLKAPETTFAEKRPDKAAAVAKQIGLVAVADDSGLCVDALQRPAGREKRAFADDVGRIAGRNRDQRNIRKLLDLMKGKPGIARRILKPVAAVAPNGETCRFGQWPEANILQKSPGANMVLAMTLSF